MTEPEKLQALREYLDRVVYDENGQYEAEGRYQAEFLRHCVAELSPDAAKTGDPDYLDWAARHLQNLAKAALAMAADVRAIGRERPLFSHGYLVLATDPDDYRPRRVLGLYFTREAADEAVVRCIDSQAEDEPEMALGPDAEYEIVPLSFQE